MSEENKEITSIEDVISIIRDYKKRIISLKEDESFIKFLRPDNFIYGLWFRGEKDYGKNGLNPSIFRKDNQKIISESTVFNYLPTINNQLRSLNNSFDRLCHMQHYDVPTRLLDWTDNILVALYFAVSYDKPNENRDSKLFVLNARALNDLVSFKEAPLNIHMHDSFGTKFRMELIQSENLESWTSKINNKYKHFDWNHIKMNKKYYDLFGFKKNQKDFNSFEKAKIISTPIAVRPNTVNGRMMFQNGLFTLHGGKINNLIEDENTTSLPAPFSLFEINENSTIMESYTIPLSAKQGIRDDLMNLRIHEGSLFPELDKQTKFIKLITD